jgi:vacuolar protein sorting-associated protein 53
MCKLVDVLDAKMKNDLIKWFIKQELNEYIVLFEENQEVLYIYKKI